MLVSGIFNYDWRYDYSSWEDAVEDWFGDFPKDSAKRGRARMELEELSTAVTEEMLASYFDLLSAGVIPADDGFTHRDWVREVLRRLDAAT